VASKDEEMAVSSEDEGRQEESEGDLADELRMELSAIVVSGGRGPMGGDSPNEKRMKPAPPSEVEQGKGTSGRVPARWSQYRIVNRLTCTSTRSRAMLLRSKTC